MALVGVRLVALVLFVGAGPAFRDAPKGQAVPRAWLMSLRAADAARLAGAGLLLAGGIVAIGRHPARTSLLAWGAVVLLAAVVWSGATELFYWSSNGQTGVWIAAAGALRIADRYAWDAAFPALLWIVCRARR